jgi:hypothetical protein
MAEAAAYPQVTRQAIKVDPPTLIDVSSVAKSISDQWYDQTLCTASDTVIRLGVMQDEYLLA